MDNSLIKNLLATIDAMYPWEEKCFLEYEEPWQLLVSTILSAQCTDDRVNRVTKPLFEKYTSVESFAEADLGELEKDIYQTGMYRMKARHIKYSCIKMINDFNGAPPRDLGDLLTLPGVGRKTANIIRGHIYREPSVVVDTHVKRVSYRLGLTTNTDPDKIEFDLMSAIPENHWIRINQQLITHGRLICKARSPKCGDCTLSAFCQYGKT